MASPESLRTPSLAAEGLRRSAGLSNSAVDIAGLVEQLGIRLILARLEKSPIEGWYARREGETFIFVNIAKPPSRQRLTAAHELGHHFLTLDRDEVDFADYAGQSWEQEREEVQAYEFARALLMGEELIRSITKDALAAGDLFEAVNAVVRGCRVSSDAAIIRLEDLGLITPSEKWAFKEQLKDRDFRERFTKVRGSLREQRIDDTFARAAKRLLEAGILSDDRYNELTRRDLPQEAK
jgi:Zn-dependent peptidase ImmA (M78 family)